MQGHVVLVGVMDVCEGHCRWSWRAWHRTGAWVVDQGSVEQEQGHLALALREPSLGRTECVVAVVCTASGRTGSWRCL